MLIILLAYFGGVLTIVSPCILPVLPFVFARADRGFTRGANMPDIKAHFYHPDGTPLAEGDRVSGRWTVRGTQQGELQGIPPTGKTVMITGIDIWRVENGKLRYVHTLTHLLQANFQGGRGGGRAGGAAGRGAGGGRPPGDASGRR